MRFFNYRTFETVPYYNYPYSLLSWNKQIYTCIIVGTCKVSRMSNLVKHTRYFFKNAILLLG